jgi:hypothetical protein
MRQGRAQHMILFQAALLQAYLALAKRLYLSKMVKDEK